MRILLILLLLFLIACNNNYPEQGFTNKKEAINRMVNGVKEGKWVEYYTTEMNVTTDTNNAYEYRLIVYKSGKPYGIERYYFKNGILLSETPYVKGKKDGIEKQYYGNGNIERNDDFINGKCTGMKSYYKSGKLEDVRTYDTTYIGVMKAKRYFEDGKLKLESEQTAKIYWIKIYDENGNLIKQSLDSLKNAKIFQNPLIIKNK